MEFNTIRTLVAVCSRPTCRTSTLSGQRVARSIIGAIAPLRTTVTVETFCTNYTHTHTHTQCVFMSFVFCTLHTIFILIYK